MRAKPSRGGRREGAGRPAAFSPNALRQSITVEPEHAEYLRTLGGSVSLGLKKLLTAPPTPTNGRTKGVRE